MLKTCSGGLFIAEGYQEAIIPAIWNVETFDAKVPDPELSTQMWRFDDKKGRTMCLIPEVTALFQEAVKQGALTGESKVFYIAKCFRYERPQAGRQREFYQMGVEILNPKNPVQALEDVRKICETVLLNLGILKDEMTWNDLASRGLGYYINGTGFECKVDKLGAQKQIAGGGPYKEGVGFAIGLERVLLALKTINQS